MEFVSKLQAYEATRKLLAAYGREDLVRAMQMDGDHSRDPECFKGYLDTITADPLSPQDALAASAEFMDNATDGLRDDRTADMIAAAKALGDDPEKGDRALWNRWISLLTEV